MTRKTIIVTVVCFLFALPSLMADNKKEEALKTQKMYFFGVAKNFSDSLAFITDISSVDNVALKKSKNAVENLEIYTDQFSNYFKKQGLQGCICASFCDKSYKAAEKKYLKMKKRLTKERGTTLKMLSVSEFKYEYVDPKTIYRNEVQSEESEE